MEKKIFDFEYKETKYYYIRYSKVDKIIISEDKNGKLKFKGSYKCTRCKGTGQVIWRRDNGICYACHGYGYINVSLNTTKNKSTAERRLKFLEIKKEEQQKQELIKCEQRRLAMIKRNIDYTFKKYTDNFYLILDTLEKSTYNNKEYIKSKGGYWSYSFNCWWIPVSNLVVNDFKGFKLYKMTTKNLIEENGELDTFKVNEFVLNYKKELNYEKDLIKWSYSC